MAWSISRVSSAGRRWRLGLGLPLALAVACGKAEPTPTPTPDETTLPPPVEEVAEGSGPIVATAEQWAWVPFGDSRCMNGSATGLGVNLAAGSDRVLVYLEGGGACFNEQSCAFLVANTNGFGKAEFATWVSKGGGRGVFDRADVDNPFHDWSYVYVPYCSGDVHAGNSPTSPTGRMHLGAANVARYLERLVPTFGGASQVVLAGTSAGGAGAALNYERVQQAFGATPVLLLDDSAPVFSDTWLKPCLQRQWREAWNLNDTLPAGCTECRAGEGGLSALLPYLASRYPERRMAMVVSDADATFRAFFGFGYSSTCTQLTTMPAEDFRQGVAELRTSLAAAPNIRLYTPASDKHGYLYDRPLGGTNVGGVKLTDWLRTLVEGGSAWEHVTP